MAFSDTNLTRAREIVARYPAGQQRSALLPMLHLVQSEQAYVSPDGIAFCADFLGLTVETVSRSFSQLVRQRLIARPEAHLVQIIDLRRLNALAGTELEEA